MLRFSLAALLVLAPAVSAQTSAVIFPSDHVNQVGIGANPGRHLTGGIMRNQFMYDRWDLEIPDGKLITKVGFRQWIRAIRGGGVSVDVEVRLGHGTRGTDRQSMSTTFASNYAGASTVGYTRKAYKLPDLPTPKTLPSKNYVLLPLDRPFRYDASKNLIVDYFVFGNSNNNKYYGYSLGRSRFVTKTEAVGHGCKLPNGKVPKLASRGGVIGGTWQHDLTEAPPGAALFAIIGDSRDKFLGAIPLPINLEGPGASGCKLFVDYDIFLVVGVASGSGYKTFQLGTPYDRRLYQREFYQQFLIVDIRKPAQFIMSNGAATRFGIEPQMGHILSFDVNARTGLYNGERTIGVFEIQ